MPLLTCRRSLLGVPHTPQRRPAAPVLLLLLPLYRVPQLVVSFIMHLLRAMLPGVSVSSVVVLR